MKYLIVILLALLSLQSNSQISGYIKTRTTFENGRYVNQPPISFAGIDQIIQAPASSVYLTGIGTDIDGVIITYFWQKLSGNNVSIGLPNSQNTTVTGLTQGQYQFQLTVIDNNGLRGYDTITVTVNPPSNINPLANAGIDQTITLPTNSVTLTGSGTDSDGSIVAYTWIKISGTGGTITNPNSASTTVTGLTEGEYIYQLTVTDNNGATANDFVKVIVQPTIPPANVPPTANAGSNISLTLPTNSTTLNGSGIDTDGTITGYSWIKISGTGGTIVSPTSATTNITGLTAGTYQYQLTVTDNLGLTGSDIVVINVSPALNVPPTANAGTDQVITLPTSTVNLSGIGTDGDGTIVSYFWKQITNYPATITTPSSQNPIITGLTTTGVTITVYQFQLTVTDDKGAIANDIVTITVNPSPSTLPTGWFTYTLPSSYHTSAGVFANDSTLVRTLWGDSIGAAGAHIAYWDGKDDQGIPINSPQSNYEIRVLINNVTYTWEGTIGNNSDSISGQKKVRGYYGSWLDVVEAGSWLYYVTGYSEGSPSIAKVSKVNFKQKTDIYSNKTNTANLNYLATDGTLVYVSYFDPFSANNSGVFAIKTVDDLEYVFSGGVSTKGTYTKTFVSMISKKNLSNARVTGLAVQRTGNLLFVSRAGINEIQVLNKTTGVLIATLTVTNAGDLSVDVSDRLIVASGTTVTRYIVNPSTGALTSNLVLSGFQDAVAVDANGSLIAVADGGNSQQVKFYNTSGTLLNTLGTANGYYTDAAVNNNKFYFNDSLGKRQTFITIQADGSFWVGDPGNFRSQKYNSSYTFLDRSQFLGASYQTRVDPNDITRVFDSFLEFSIDYSQPLQTGWTLVNNWGANINKRYDPKPFFDVNTFPNGRTYGFLRQVVNSLNYLEVVEFPTTGVLRQSGILRPGLGYVMKEMGGGLQELLRGNIGGKTVVKDYPLTGYNAGGYPTWGAGVIIATTPTLTANDPIGNITGEMVTSSNKVIIYNPSVYQTYTPQPRVPWVGYHLAAMEKFGNRWWWKNEQSTHPNYMGVYPAVNYFESGNLVNNYGGGALSVVGRNILTSYHGEFWKNGQTNYYNHYWDDGLAIGQFGTDREVTGHGVPAAPKMAGNALTPRMVKHDDSTMYLYHGDESDHSGLHRWKISGVNTIAEIKTAVKSGNNLYPPILPYTDLMAGLPFDKTLTNNTAGWTRNLLTDSIVSLYNNNFAINTSRLVYDKLVSPDLYFIFAQPLAKTYYANRALNATATTSWSITGNIAFAYQGGTLNGQNNNAFIEVYDEVGKTLATFYADMNLASYPSITYKVWGNTQQIYTAINDKSVMSFLQPFQITATSSNMTFTYAGVTVTTTKLDPTANWAKPTNFRVRFNSTGISQNYAFRLGVTGLKLYIDNTPTP